MAVLVTGAGYQTLTTLVLICHVLFLVWVVLGALLARSRPVLRVLHIASLIWGVLTELVVPCPLTLLENCLEQRAGVQPYQSGFLLHYLDKLVYPDFPSSILVSAAVTVCVFNLAYYARLMWIERHTG